MAAEVEQQLQTNGHAKPTEETLNSTQSNELRRRKRNKFIVYVALFIVFQIAVLLFFSLYIMKIRTPEFSVRFATFDYTAAENASFNITMNAELSVKNDNFGPYNYKNSTIYFYYNDVSIGEAFIYQGKAGFKSTKKFNVIVNFSSKESKLRNDFNSGTLILTSKSKLEGKVKLIFFMKKKKSTEMNCSIIIGSDGKVVRDIRCD
uniref:Late embryogenesis abundant protein LEA-2 subgroup domain-containing protein n=1 Tax=Solanum lycopersicum TaxID=4081 RepID=A0A3Q7FG95_SOLLC